MFSSAAIQLFKGGLERAALAVRSIGGYCVNRIRDGKDASAEADTIGLEPARIPAAVKTLVMLSNNQRRTLEKVDSTNYLNSVLHMLAHMDPFFVAQRTTLQQDGIRYADLADVVQECPVFERDDLAAGQPELFAESQAIANNAIRVAARLDVSSLERRRQRAKRRAVIHV